MLPAYVEPEEPVDETVIEEEDEAPQQAEQPRHAPQPQQRATSGGEDGEGRDRKRRKRRRRRGGKDRDREHGAPAESTTVSAPADGGFVAGSDENAEAGHEEPVGVAETVEASDDGPGKKRRRGKRGGKRNRREDGEGETETSAAASDETIEDGVSEGEPGSSEPTAVTSVEEPVALAPANDDTPSVEKPKKPRRAAKPKKAAAEIVAETPVAEIASETSAEIQAPVSGETAEAATDETPKARSSRRKPASVEATVVPVVSSNVAEEPEAKTEEKPKRAGWWQRKGFF